MMHGQKNIKLFLLVSELICGDKLKQMTAAKCRRNCPSTAAAASSTTGILLNRHPCHLKYLCFDEFEVQNSFAAEGCVNEIDDVTHDDSYVICPVPDGAATIQVGRVLNLVKLSGLVKLER